MKVTKDTIMLDVLQEYPQASKVLTKHNLGCATCFGMVFEDIETIARANGINREKLLKELNQLNDS